MVYLYKYNIDKLMHLPMTNHLSNRTSSKSSIIFAIIFKETVFVRNNEMPAA